MHFLLYIQKKTLSHPDKQQNQEKEISPTPSNTPNTSVQQVNHEPEASTQTLHEHKINHESNIPAASSEYPKKRTILERENESQERELYVWEIALKKPYPLFLKWWADTHYKPQGGHRETGARLYACRQFYNDPEGTEDIFEEFLEYLNTITNSCNQLQNDGQKAILPSCFAPLPEATEENKRTIMNNIKSLIERGAAVLMPTKSVTPTSQCLPFAEAVGQAVIKALPNLKQSVDIGEERRRFNHLRNQPDAQITLLNEWIATGDQDLKLEATRMTAISNFKFERDENGDLARVLSEVKAIEESVPVPNSIASNIDWNALAAELEQWEKDAWEVD